MSDRALPTEPASPPAPLRQGRPRRPGSRTPAAGRRQPAAATPFDTGRPPLKAQLLARKRTATVRAGRCAFPGT